MPSFVSRSPPSFHAVAATPFGPFPFFFSSPSLFRYASSSSARRSPSPLPPLLTNLLPPLLLADRRLFYLLCAPTRCLHLHSCLAASTSTCCLTASASASTSTSGLRLHLHLLPRRLRLHHSRPHRLHLHSRPRRILFYSPVTTTSSFSSCQSPLLPPPLFANCHCFLLLSRCLLCLLYSPLCCHLCSRPPPPPPPLLVISLPLTPPLPSLLASSSSSSYLIFFVSSFPRLIFFVISGVYDNLWPSSLFPVASNMSLSSRILLFIVSNVDGSLWPSFLFSSSPTTSDRCINR